ncbi:unnamed protein product [Prunus armeniaca]
MEEPSPRQKDGGAGLRSRGLEMRWALRTTQACAGLDHEVRADEERGALCAAQAWRDVGRRDALVGCDGAGPCALLGWSWAMRAGLRALGWKD